MKTTYDIVDILWAKISGSALDTATTGGLYKNQRPANSKLEDVVINSLPVPNDQIQRTVANVNIHVPDIPIVINTVQSLVPNFVRLKSLTATAITVLNNTQSSDLYYEVQQDNMIQDVEAKDHYSNIRIEFFIENL